MEANKQWEIIQGMMVGQFTADDDHWVTINGTHVLIGEGGEIKGGPDGIKKHYANKSGGSKKGEANERELHKSGENVSQILKEYKELGARKRDADGNFTMPDGSKVSAKEYDAKVKSLMKRYNDEVEKQRKLGVGPTGSRDPKVNRLFEDPSKSDKASETFKPGNHTDKATGVKFDVDKNGNRVIPDLGPQVQVDISREDGSQTFWTVRGGKRKEYKVPKGMDVDAPGNYKKIMKSLGLDPDKEDIYTKIS